MHTPRHPAGAFERLILLAACLALALQVWKAILTDRIDFNAPELKQISAPARELLRGLLERDPRKRVKPSEALKHAWIQVGGRAAGGGGWRAAGGSEVWGLQRSWKWLRAF